MNEEIKELLQDIQEWMIENNYECGDRGSELYSQIQSILDKINE